MCALACDIALSVVDVPAGLNHSSGCMKQSTMQLVAIVGLHTRVVAVGLALYLKVEATSVGSHC